MFNDKTTCLYTFKHRNCVGMSREYANLEKALWLIQTIFNQSIWVSTSIQSNFDQDQVIDFCIVMFYTLMILMKFSFVPQHFFRIFFLGSRSGSWPWSGFHYEIHWKQLFFIYERYPPNLVSLRKVFVKIKILFRIRIRIMTLLWISIPDLHFIHRRHPPNFVWIR